MTPETYTLSPLKRLLSAIDRCLAMISNIRLEWKKLAMINALAYNTSALIMTEKVLLNWPLGPNVIKVFCP
jgi:hypothetical protein